MSDFPLAPIIAEMGVTVAMDDTDRIVEVLVIGKTYDIETGQTGLVMSHNGVDWIAQRGLLQAALAVQAASDVQRLGPAGDD